MEHKIREEVDFQSHNNRSVSGPDPGSTTVLLESSVPFLVPYLHRRTLHQDNKQH